MEISLLLAIALLVGLFFWLRRYSGQKRIGGQRRGGNRALDSPGRAVRGHTQRELLRLVGGNRALAERLVEQVHLRNPSHSEQWCWEKAIYDIERDRHSS